ncbi:MAG: hypothetical protein LBV31_00330, partial [Prevotellaceae bacterium]|nr:hypothetical protein [Prevotellaceae bacterium]
MKKDFSTAILPHIVAVILFIIIAFVYCQPQLEGKVLQGHDTGSWRAMAHETLEYNATHDDNTLWTNSMFGGMPVYQIAAAQPNYVINYVNYVLRLLGAPAFYFFLYLLCFYILALCFGLNPWLSIVSAIVFTFPSYNVIIIAAGHNTKAITIAYMAPLIASVWLAFRQKRIAGAVLTAFFLALAILANHVQILYYTLFVLLFFGIVELIYSIIEKKISDFLKTTGVLLVAVAIAVGINATSLLTTYEYGQYTMRGKSNGLTMDTQSSQEGLNKQYITQWSYGIGETLTTLIPNFNGGASGGKLSANSETAKYLDTHGVPNIAQIMEENQFPLYWGTQPGTSGPVYFGAAAMFLFVLGLIIVKKREKWWIVPMIILTLMLSWGRNFMWLTDIFIDYVPMYNKFRTVSMTLVATGFGVALLAILALKQVFDEKDKSVLLKPIYIAAGITGGICLLFAVIPSLAGNFVAPNDVQLTGQNAFLKDTLPLDRKALLSADAWRSLAFVLLTAALLYLYAKNLVKDKVAYIMLGLFFIVDMCPVDKRYLGKENFQTKRDLNVQIEPSAADTWILNNDKSYYRVLDATKDIFNDAMPAHFHKNIGGYHAAKLRRYQELINMQLGR